MNATPSSPPARLAPPRGTALLVAVVFYVCFFSGLGALGLVGPDEPRYAAIAREMAESGDWVTPQLFGQPWFEKPALYYWSAAAMFRLLGVNEFAARLPSALAGALATFALAGLAWRAYGAAPAWAVLFIFPTCLGVFSFARAATQDMLFAATLTFATVAAYALCCEVHTARRASLLLRIAFGLFLGLATLAKGPAALILAGGSVALWGLGSRHWREALRLAHPLVVTAFCLVALPWYLVCAARNPDFARTFLLAHNIERYLTPMFRHEQPFWFFGPILLLGLLPWTVLLGSVARDAWRAWRQESWAGSPGFFMLCWATFPMAFFSFSKSKLPGYILPALAPLALLTARSVTRLTQERPGQARWYLVAIGGSFVALAATAGHWLRGLPAEAGLSEPGQLLGWLVLTIAGGLMIAVLALRRRAAAALVASAVVVAVLVEGANLRVLPHLDRYLSPRVAARAAQVLPGVPEGVFAFRLHRAWRYGLSFYLHRELPEWNAEAQPPAWVFTSAEGLAELTRRGRKFVVLEQAPPRAFLVQVLAPER